MQALVIQPWKIRLTWVLRLCVGAIFVFSGITKAIDPWGTLYKVETYAVGAGIEAGRSIDLALVMLLCMTEFASGMMLALGCFRGLSAWMVTLIMAFMLPLSLWIAVADPVEDCGCFGDAFVISNWATFFKNIVLLVSCIWLLRFNRFIHWIVTPALQWIALIMTCIFIGAVEACGYISQPLVDFRQYKEGGGLIADSSEVGADEFKFIYEINGQRVEFSENDTLPEESDSCVYIDRIQSSKTSYDKYSSEKDKTLRIWSKEGDLDMTEEILNYPEELLVFIPDFSTVSLSTAWKLNSIYEWSAAHGVEMVAVVAGSESETDNWIDLTMAEYPVFLADDTQIKEVVRGNPGIVALKNGVVLWKRNLSGLNTEEFIQSKDFEQANDLAKTNVTLSGLSLVFASVIAFLVFLSFTPQMKNMFFSKNKLGVNKDN